MIQHPDPPLVTFVLTKYLTSAPPSPADIVGEDTITHWHKKGSHPKGRNVFLKDMEPFIKWLEEAEEEEGEEEDE
jgi:hypothetical protein